MSYPTQKALRLCVCVHVQYMLVCVGICIEVFLCMCECGRLRAVDICFQRESDVGTSMEM